MNSATEDWIPILSLGGKGMRKITIEAIPLELRAKNCWLNSYSKKVSTGKSTKPPIDPKTGGSGSSTDPRTWGTFNQAINRWARSNPRAIFFKGASYDATSDVR